jgi:hypothetical protein
MENVHAIELYKNFILGQFALANRAFLISQLINIERQAVGIYFLLNLLLQFFISHKILMRTVSAVHNSRNNIPDLCEDSHEK